MFLIRYKEVNLPEEISGSKLTVRKIHPEFKQILHDLPNQGKVMSCRVAEL